MCDEGVEQVIKGCQDIISDPENHFLTEVFADKINQLGELTEEEKNQYMERNRQMMAEAFPAYQSLIDGMTALKGSGINPGGLAGFSNGRKYYEALVKSTTGSGRSIKDMKTLLLNRLNEDLSAINEILKDNESLYTQASEFSFSLTDPEEILADLKQKIQTDFPVLETETTYTIKTVHPSLEDVMSPALYMVAPIDRLSENTIYINEKQSGDNRMLYATLAHEGYPGHLYQTVFSCAQAPCNLRRVISFPGYSEGWGIYAEYYSYSLDAGADSRLAQIRAHNFSASMAIYALLDIYINYDNWDMEKTAAFLKECYGVENSAASDATFHMIVAEPGYYLKYYVGYLEFCQLRHRAEQKLGEAFSPVEFHRFILETGTARFGCFPSIWKDGWRRQNRGPLRATIDMPHGFIISRRPVLFPWGTGLVVGKDVPLPYIPFLHPFHNRIQHPFLIAAPRRGDQQPFWPVSGQAVNHHMGRQRFDAPVERVAVLFQAHHLEPPQFIFRRQICSLQHMEQLQLNAVCSRFCCKTHSLNHFFCAFSWQSQNDMGDNVANACHF